MRFRLDDAKYPVKGLVCSTNYDPQNQEVVINYGCDDICAGNNKCEFEKGESVFVGVCPKGCLSKIEKVVYGQKQYKLESSVCRAAIHDGVISSDGGTFNLKISFMKYVENEIEKIDGSDNNGISSQDFRIDVKGQYVFGFSKYEHQCPITNVR